MRRPRKAGAHRRRHRDVARKFRGRAARRRRRGSSPSTRLWPKRPITLSSPRGRPATTPRPRDRWVLLFRQRRHRRALCAAAPRYRPRGDRRFRRASRQRLAGNLLGRQVGDVLLDPSDAALSRHRRGHRERRAQHGRQCAASPGRRRRGSSATPSRTGFCRGCANFAPELIVISAGFDAHVRDPLANINLIEERFRLGDAEDHGHRRSLRRGPRRLGAGRRLRSRGAGNSAAAHVTALMRG